MKNSRKRKDEMTTPKEEPLIIRTGTFLVEYTEFHNATAKIGININGLNKFEIAGIIEYLRMNSLEQLKK